MLLVKTKLKEIKGKGIGLIADEFIKEGTKVWELNEFIDIPIKEKDIPNSAKDFYEIYGVVLDEDTLMLNTDNARFINHSKNPNLRCVGKKGPNFASRDIQAGEEITINYNDFDEREIPFEVIEDK